MAVAREIEGIEVLVALKRGRPVLQIEVIVQTRSGIPMDLFCSKCLVKRAEVRKMRRVDSFYSNSLSRLVLVACVSSLSCGDMPMTYNNVIPVNHLGRNHNNRTSYGVMETAD